jgi:DNA-binding PadR family transcriptional regulator
MTQRRSLMESVVLGAVAERPGYGYELGKRISARMGPGWQFNPSGIYATLDKLEKRSLVEYEQRERGHRSPRSNDRVIYRATEAGVEAFEDWLRRPVRKEPIRADVLARLAVSRPEHAPLLLGALDGYERECLDMIASADAHTSDDLNPWDRLMSEGLRDQALQHVRAELNWIKSMRVRIGTFGDVDRAR